MSDPEGIDLGVLFIAYVAVIAAGLLLVGLLRFVYGP